MATIARINRDGTRTNVEIRPSYANKPKAVENLMKGLPDLLAAPSTSAEFTGTPSNYDTTWTLDNSGDTIHRHILLENETSLPNILEQIKAASRELNHDPHIYTRGTQLTISCTTHVPPGLSMKDVKLARKINEILQDVPTVSIEETTQVKDSSTDEQWKAAEQENMKAIKKAKEDCNCG